MAVSRRRTPATDRILVLDGETRTALAVTRSLGHLAVDIGVAAHAPGGLAQRSRYVTTLFECPDPQEAPEMYLRWLVQVVEEWKPRMLLPLTDVSLTLCLRLHDILREQTILPTLDPACFAAIADKGQLLAVAQELGIKVPQTVLIPGGDRKTDAHDQIIRGFHYPAVLKPNTTVSDLRSHFVKGGVHYPEDAEEVASLVYGESDSALHEIDFLLQERIEGQGVGVFALCHDGEALAIFCHRRILEKPPTGGRSVLCESIPESEAPVEQALALLRHFKVQGMAMVEFKQTGDGEFCLMEINPRFWGSLQLAIDAGRDFPAMLYRLYSIGQPFPPAALEQFVQAIQPYETGRRLRWLLGTFDHFLIRLKESPSEALKATLRENVLELWTQRHRTRLEVLRWDDRAPFFFEFRRWVADLFANTPSDY
ncbi:MAG: ATP-grasp domain-containing protein [Bdellovibrionales bacterium]|nr:ATP-grasp domain-containing protein [Bdellovibrionales bacterium]